jgi:D-alanine transaminase
MADALPIAYLAGEFLPIEECRISPLDRSFLFGDGIYEGIAAYDGRIFQLPQHIARLQRSLAELEMPDPLGDEAAWTAMLRDLIGRNGDGDQSVYVQVSRGAYAGRDHRIPAEQHPMVFAFSAAGVGLPPGVELDGVAAITQQDLRWGRCDVKAVALLANVLHRTAADREGAAECLLIKDGLVIEGSSTSLFIVKDGVVRSNPDGEVILPGVTRGFVISMIERAKIGFEWRGSDLQTLLDADEVWICSSLRELMPVTHIDGQAIGDGRPGPDWRLVLSLMREHRDSQLS